MWHKQSFTQFWSQSDAYSRRSSLKLTYIHHPLVVCTHQICCAVAVPIALSQDRLLHGHNRLVNWTPCSRMRESKLKTWDTLKEIINKKTFKSDLPSCFIHEGIEVISPKNVADKFNKYFTEIGPKLAKSIDTANKAPFNHYLTTPCAASFNFVYTKPDDIEKIIRNLKPKSSAGYDNISTKLLKGIKNVISRPLSIIINQSLCTGIFPDKLKIA